MASKSNGVDVSGWARAPPKAEPFCVRFAKAIYDPGEHTFLGRTAKRWGIVLAFYFVFYAVLALLSGVCFLGLVYNLPPDRPYFTLQQSLIGGSPGVACRPRSEAADAVVRYNVDNSSHLQHYTEQLDDFLAPYQNVSWLPPAEACSAADNYGFPYSPCFYIKVNKIMDWMPEFYDDVNSLPADMPEDLQEHIKTVDPIKRHQVWISCAAEANSSRVQFPGARGLPAALYPYTNTDGYLSPLVPVQITPTVNQLVAVRCWAWAKNIRRDKSLKEPHGYTRILIYIEDHSQDQKQQQ